MKSILGALVMTAALGATTTASAQQHHGHEPGMRGDHEPMSGMTFIQQFAPAAVLREREALGLSDEQVTRLTALAEETAAVRDKALATHETHRNQLQHALMAPVPDPAIVRTHFDAAHAAMGHAHWVGVDAAIRSLAVLTDNQRAQVRASVGKQGAGSPMMGGGSMAGRVRSESRGRGSQPETGGAATRPNRSQDHSREPCRCCP